MLCCRMFFFKAFFSVSCFETAGKGSSSVPSEVSMGRKLLNVCVEEPLTMRELLVVSVLTLSWSKVESSGTH